MGAQSPPNLLAFILCIVTTVMSIILLGISGYLNPYFCGFGSLCAATGVGITAGVFGMLLGLLGIFWLLFSELWDVGILRFVLVFGIAFVALLSFISGVLYAVQLLCCQVAAGACFSFFTMLSSIGMALFCWMAGGGGTASA